MKIIIDHRHGGRHRHVGKGLIKRWSTAMRKIVRAMAVWAFAALAITGPARAQTVHYYYDALGRLIGTYPQSGVYTAYNYDSAGNRISRDQGARSPPSASAASTLTPGQTLVQGQQLVSTDGRFTLIVQGDSNLVLYQGGSPPWGSNTVNTGSRIAAQLVMQGDGNLVLYDPQLYPLWATGTNGNPGAYAVLQSDGNFVIYLSGKAIWAINTCCH